MASIIKTPSQVAQEYLDNLKNARPELNTFQTDSDWWIRSRAIGGVISGVYADLNRVSNDAFPQSARREAINNHLNIYFGAGLHAANPGVGNLSVTGTSGAIIPLNTVFVEPITGNQYVCTQATNIAPSATGQVPVQSILSGQNQNLIEATTLNFQTPIFGIMSTAIALSPGITDASDEESTQSGANRVLERIREPARGGTETDYKNWAKEAEASVVSVNINRHAYGLGTIQVVITAGTNDIDNAIDNDLPISIIPSDALREIVRNYIERLNPINDVTYVDGPTSVAVDVTVLCAFNQGDKDTVVAEANCTQGHLVEREVKRALYKIPIGGRDVNGVKSIRASDLEEQIDQNLSSSTLITGLKYQIVGDRQVTLAGGTPNLTILASQVVIPGTITIGSL